MQNCPFSGHAWLSRPEEMGFQFTMTHNGERITVVLHRGNLSAAAILAPEGSARLESALKQILAYDPTWDDVERMTARSS